MDIKKLRQFIVLSETRSFSLAAQKLHLGQPALSTSIRNLEDAFGCQLFHRTTRGVDLTAAGQAALADVRKTVFHAQQARTNARLAAAGKSGILKVGFVGSVVNTLMPKLLARFCAEHPEVRLELHESTNSMLIERIKTAELDLGVARFPVDIDPELAITPLQDDCLMAALPRHHALASLDEVPLEQLTCYPFIHYTGEVQGGLAPIIDALFQQEGLSLKISHRAVQVQTVLGLVEEGLGVALVPSTMLARVSPRVVLKPLAVEKAPRLRLGLVHLIDNRRPALASFCASAIAWRDAPQSLQPRQGSG